jgi:CRISPR/Cas system CSM-associated protein Csm4 (group 5 of RAMP superfamily)
MQQALLVRLRPTGPWRYGPSDGALDRVDTLYRSDRLFSAVTLAMRQLGLLDTWLDAMARSPQPAVAFASLFPFQGETLFVTPPVNLWPPPSSLVTSPSPVYLTKVRWRAAHFVPLSLVDALLNGQAVLADQWIPDPESGCLLRRDRPSSSPFRVVARGFSPVDRLRLTSTHAETSACVEFEAGSGLWTVARFFDEAAHQIWNSPLRAAFRLLADTGFGGGRSKGWGQVQAPEFETGTWPALILPKVARAARNNGHQPETSRSYWLMSLYSPAAMDSINWSGGQYELVVRNGRVDGATGELKKSVRLVTEGCVLDADAEPVGTAVDVAPAGFAHPVYRSGIALALLMPPPKPSSEARPLEAIVPPELEATPFPFPLPEVVTEPEPVAEGLPEPEIATEPLGEVVPGATAPPVPEPAGDFIAEALPKPETAEPLGEVIPEPAQAPAAEPISEAVPELQTAPVSEPAIDLIAEAPLAPPKPETEPEPLTTPRDRSARFTWFAGDLNPVLGPEPTVELVAEPSAAMEPGLEPIVEPVPEAPTPPISEPVAESVHAPEIEPEPATTPKDRSARFTWFEGDLEPVQGTEPTVELVAEPSAEVSEVEPGLKLIVEPVPEAPTALISEPVSESIRVPESMPEHATTPILEPAVEHVGEPIAEVEPGLMPIVEPVPETPTPPISEPVRVPEAAPEYATAPIPEPAVEHVAEPVVEPVPEATEHIGEAEASTEAQPEIAHEPLIEVVPEDPTHQPRKASPNPAEDGYDI